jgi:hypothetical protein
MKLILKNHGLAPLYTHENSKPEDIAIPVKLFYPCGAATWYLYEYNPETETAFGYVVGMGNPPELGYIPVAELQAFRGRLGLGIERDRSWNPKTTLAEVKAKHEKPAETPSEALFNS